MQQHPTRIQELISAQDGIITRQQLIDLGLTRSQAIQQVRVHRWRSLYAGVYITHLGPVSARAQVQGALLRGGPGAAAALETALWLWGFVDEPPLVLQICIPFDRSVRPAQGVRFIRRRNLADLVHPAQSPARTRFESTVLDVAETKALAEPVITLVLSAIQRGFTTAERLVRELVSRSRHRHRALITEVLADAAEGVLSALERRYLRTVERAHGLPRGRRNLQREVRRGKPFYDVDYRRWRTIVELDGRAAHPRHLAFRDWRRDNASTVSGDDTLRYGWADVVAFPCEIAEQVAAVLRLNGWRGELKRCPRCRDRAASAAVRAADAAR